ncbi:MAG: ABC transporter permease [Eubacteriales bacterium]|nr:ABC transporter permease [Eubacteriales bacterium]
MKATRKDFFREIKKSSGRFLSILFIVALGVAFFSGIRASEPDMRLTGDSYFDGANLMDIKVISTLGITEDDIQAFAALEMIENCEGAYSADFLTNTEDSQFALHIMSLPKTMNEVSVTEGRLPEKTGECLADDEMGYQVGDKICLESGTDEPVSDTLKTDELTVVGTGSSPCYISFNRGSTTIGTGSLEGFLFVPEDSFELEVYTEGYMQVKGAKELMAYTDEYEELIDEAMDQVKELSGERGIIRRRELVDEATEELDKAKMDLEEGREKARQELEDAAAEIADAENQLAEAKEQIRDGRNQIAEAKATLMSRQEELESARAQYESGIAQLADGKAQYESGKAAFDEKKSAAKQQIAEGEAGLLQIEAGIQQAKEGAVQIEAVYNQLAECEEQIRVIENSYDISEYTDPTTEIGQQYAILQGTATAVKEQIEQQNLDAQYFILQETIAGLQMQYDELAATLEAAKQQLASAEQQLADTKAMLEESEAELAGVPSQLQSGQEQINMGWSEISRQEQQLESGAAEITENEAKLAEAKEELEEGRTKAAQEIAEGEAEIADAEEQIEDIPEASWYIYDRSTLPEYTGYGENADRMRAIGQVFPVLFFLVAALISLTSMTRMVEEQRVQIGTMKALGYSKGAIAFKYLGYALIATIAGSILGVLVGEKILPYIIIYAYGIMYHHINEILVPYVAGYGIAASAAAVVCTMAATLFSCYRELGAQAAILMRPPAPKIGKRVFLERIPFIWKHLNFSWKSSVRNLMRYKKRFFMTIFGIGGCMALMIVGYGIKDSVYEIVDIQYAKIQTYDGQILLQEDLTDKDRENLDTFLSEDGDIDRHMDAYMKNIILSKDRKERQTYIMVFGDLENVEEYMDFHDRRTGEKYELDNEGVIISEKTAKLLDADVGDTVTVKNEEDGDREVTISHICENYMGHYIYMTPEYYSKVFEEEPEYNSILFAGDESYNKQQLETAGEKIIEREEVLSISYMHDIQEQLDNMLSSLNLVIIVLIISAGMLAFVVLYNLNTINITERQRELATLKVLGFYDPEVAIYVFRENILLTFIGAAVGIVLGKILHLFVIQTVEVDAAMFGRSIYLPSFVYSLLFTVGFSLLINGIMYFKLKKISMVESLKSVE